MRVPSGRSEGCRGIFAEQTGTIAKSRVSDRISDRCVRTRGLEGGVMKRAVSMGRIAVLMFVVFWGAGRGRAETVSYTGMLANPQDSFATIVSVGGGRLVTLQTYGFGGGVNAAGTAIAAGGVDPFLGVFSGTGDSALFVDGTSDILTNFTPGCPSAWTVTVGSVAGQCGDVDLQFTGLAPGTYT